MRDGRSFPSGLRCGRLVARFGLCMTNEICHTKTRLPGFARKTSWPADSGRHRGDTRPASPARWRRETPSGRRSARRNAPLRGMPRAPLRCAPRFRAAPTSAPDGDYDDGQKRQEETFSTHVAYLLSRVRIVRRDRIRRVRFALFARANIEPRESPVNGSARFCAMCRHMGRVAG